MEPLDSRTPFWGLVAGSAEYRSLPAGGQVANFALNPLRAGNRGLAIPCDRWRSSQDPVTSRQLEQDEPKEAATQSL